MTVLSLAMQERHVHALRNHFFSPTQRTERVAFILFGQNKIPSDGTAATTFCLSKEIVILDD